MKKMCLFMSLFLFIPIAVFAQPPKEIFTDANKQYEAGSFADAIRLYEDLLGQGWESANLYYNLGNAYFKTGKNGFAILNYERARALSSRDEDINFNLEYAKTFSLQESEKQENPITGLFVAIYGLFSANELSILFTVLYFCLAGLICALFFMKNEFLRRAAMILGLCIAVIGSWSLIKISDAVKPWAIVVKQDSSIRSGPGLEYTVGFSVPEGKKIVVLRKKEEWCEIGLKSEGVKGWTEAENIENIR